jgi:hypothetical protein
LPRFTQLVNGNPPHIADPKDERYAFEKRVTKATGGDPNILAAEYVNDPRAVAIAEGRGGSVSCGSRAAAPERALSPITERAVM